MVARRIPSQTLKSTKEQLLQSASTRLQVQKQHFECLREQYAALYQEKEMCEELGWTIYGSGEMDEATE